jgi:polysaccharide export outer membrane protein
MNIVMGGRAQPRSGLGGLQRLAYVAVLALLFLAPGEVAAQLPEVRMEVADSTLEPTPRNDATPVLKLGAGDAVNIQVYGRPELSTTAYVADDGTIPVPLAGPVLIAGLSPAKASMRVAAALRDGQFLLNPQVTIILNQFRSQQVSVLGEVKSPARFPVDSRLNVFDLLAQAGGVTENGADVIYLLRPDKDGHVTRIPIDLKGLTDGKRTITNVNLRGGDVIYVPHAGQFYIFGEVQSPNMYRLEPGMTVLEAISRGGGITQRGSDSRIEIKRRTATGGYQTISASLTDRLEPDDVVRVKERIF